MTAARPLVLLLPVLLLACGDFGEVDVLRWPLNAFCTVNVDGKGVLQVETDYLPHVVACENGAADTEALKAQAVAARSFMYYKIKEEGGSICDGQACQVYTCKNKPQQKHFDAVRDTAGQVLVYSSVVVCTFYVAGAKPSTPTCKALSSDPDPTNTEKYVTYNEGKTGADVIQSPLGWVDPGNKYNRGCKSQNGAHCLSLAGKTYPDILHFYYGADIQLLTAPGSCITPPPDQGPTLLDQGPTLTDQALVTDGIVGLDHDHADAGGGGGDGDGGCNCRLGSGEPPLLAASLVLVVFGLVRRRRRR